MVGSHRLGGSLAEYQQHDGQTDGSDDDTGLFFQVIDSDSGSQGGCSSVDQGITEQYDGQEFLGLLDKSGDFARVLYLRAYKILEPEPL
jgi:hypothetical protein